MTKYIQFKTWRTVTIGNGLRTAPDFRRAFKKAECEMVEWSKRILELPAFAVSKKKKEIELIALSVWQLGFRKGAPLSVV
jgi:hypothetical protein